MSIRKFSMHKNRISTRSSNDAVIVMALALLLLLLLLLLLAISIWLKEALCFLAHEPCNFLSAWKHVAST